MASYPYVLTPAKLKQFLKDIQSAGVPDKVTYKYLESMGFKSKNDRAIVPVLKFIDFIDSSGVPTSYWQHFRNKREAPAVLGKAIQDTYAELFTVFPDAPRKDTEALRNFFSTHTKVGDRALSGIVATFQALCELADFSADPPKMEGEPAASGRPTPSEIAATVAKATTTRDGVTINVNIEIGVPATDDPDVYDHFFKALKKHVLS
jgi:hypothetical protein